MRTRSVLATARALMLAALTPITADAQAARDFVITIDGRTWISTGHTEMSTSTSRVDPLSELRWRGVDSVVTEIAADFVWWQRLVLRAALGGGVVATGVLIDEDFSATDRTGRFSRTRSSVDEGSVAYGSVDVGARVLRWGESETRPAATLDVLGGYQLWVETYDAFGATSAFPDEVPTIPSRTRALTHEYYWHSLRIGARLHVPIDRRWSAAVAGAFIPWSYSEIRDRHHLRSDLDQDLSFLSVASGGWGVQAEGRVGYRVWRDLSIEAGYRYWRIDSGEGTTEVRGVTGTGTIGYNGATTERYGPFVGVRYQF